MSKVSRFFIVSFVVILAVYLGAIVGIRAAISVLPRLSVPVDGNYGIIDSELEFSDGLQILPNYQLQKSVDVRNIRLESAR